MKADRLTLFDRMREGELVEQTDFSILWKMARGYRLCRKLNKTSMLRQGRRARLLHKLFGSVDGDPFYVQSPLYVDYGCNIHVGKNFLSNYNVVMQDEAKIRIGDNVMIASNVVITTDLHPKDRHQRKVHWNPKRFPSGHRGIHIHAKPVTIEDDVWICAGAVICPGVTIGEGSIIGAGSVVVRDVPAGVFAAGVPCRVICHLDAELRGEAMRVEQEGIVSLRTAGEWASRREGPEE